jgi:hypothetical protein
MKMAWIHLLVPIFAALCTAAAPAQIAGLQYESLVRPAGAGVHRVPIGLCEDYPEETTTPAILRGDMELLKRSGIRILRISFRWDGIEPAQGQYNWLFWDDYVKMAVEEYGITLIPYVCRTPAWNSTGDTTNFWKHPPKDYEAFGAFMTALVNRYKKWIKTWELWNEPDIDAAWSGTAGDLARLTKTAAKAVRAADPEAKVVLAGIAHDTKFLRSLFRDHGISPFVDVVDCHSYFETWNGEPLETVIDYVNTIADIIATHGNGQSLWMAEVGYSTYRRADGFVSDSYWSTYEYEHTPRFQAVALWRTLTMLLSTEKMAAISWYKIKDLPPSETVAGDVNTRNLGVATVDFTSKPAEGALAFFARFFGKKARCIDGEVTVARTIGSDSHVHAFRMEDGSTAVVAWLKTNVKGRTLPGRNGSLKDARRERITVGIPGTGPVKARMYTETGVATPFEEVTVRDGRMLVADLDLRGGTITILKIESRERTR